MRIKDLIYLVAKNWWEIYSHPESLLAQIFKGVYFPKVSLVKAKKGWRPSYAWSSIWSTKWVFERGGRWKIGDGRQVDVRRDNWLPHGSPIIYSEDLLVELNINNVSDLLLSQGRMWNRELVEHVFCPNTALQILSLPLSVHGGVADSLFWTGSIDGVYSSKLGYSFIKDHDARSQTSASLAVSPLPANLWKKIWKSNAIPRCKELAWRAFCSLLPVRDSLWRRGVEVDPTCPLCGEENEIVSHLWLNCPMSKCFWFAYSLGLRLDSFSSLPEFLLQFLADADADDGAISRWLSASYALWEARNKVIFQDRPFSCDVVLQRAFQLELVDDPTSTPFHPAIEQAVSWCRPPQGLFKVNVDGSWRSDSTSGLGMAARNHEGLILAAAADVVERTSSALETEALALRWSIGLAISLGFRRVCLETDCLKLFQLWKKPPDGRNYLATILNDCFQYCRSFDFISLSFVRRPGNTVADYLARHASSFAGCVWIEEVPPEVETFVTADILASMPPV
ncbi:uncharacterized protein LOC130712417 [Lotus japonicus]|uniref:uncharacterized protein LOC130712417 n=1 Tax=Lotus japonicus TaxID=34305 RepID=UPI0025833F55|nr:uncharacterized protein LOC130712417 [Lotus japonicus]